VGQAVWTCGSPEDAFGSGGPAQRCHDRPVDVDLSEVVEVVGEDVDRDVAYSFRDLGVGDAGSASGVEGLVVDVAAGAHDRVGKGEHGLGVRLVATRHSCLFHLLGRHLGDVLADVGVCGQAVRAAVVLGDGDRDPLAHPGTEPTAGEGRVQVEIALQQGGAVRHHLRHVRGEPERLMGAGK